MEDLVQSQIRESCTLALPEGLRDLMSDISREVLRAQPADLYKFIVSYLEAMLLARDSLCVACRVCRDVCKCTCDPELEDELRNIGLDEEDVETAKNVVMEYFDKGDVKEGNLLLKLYNKTEIDEDKLPGIQHAVQEAFQKHWCAHQTKFWVEAELSNAVGQQAANYTLQYYDRLQEDKELSWNSTATQIQAAYRGETLRAPVDGWAVLREKLAQIESSSMVFEPKVKKTLDEPEKASTSKLVRNNVVRLSLSSSSLAGSHVNLPKYVPYSVHDLTYVDFEERETVRKNIDYTLETHFKDSKKEEGSKKIAFYEQHVLHEIESGSIEEEEKIEEEIAEHDQSEAVSVDENIIVDTAGDDTDSELESAFDEGSIGQNSFIEQTIQEFVSYITTKDEKLNGTTVDSTSAIESNVDGTVEGIIPQAETITDLQEKDKKVESTRISFNLQVDEHKQLDYTSIDDEYFGEEMEVEEDIGRKKNITNKVGSKAQIEMMKTLKKKLITLSKTTLTDDKEQVSLSLSSD